jgi:hypothetical protein
VGGNGGQPSGGGGGGNYSKGGNGGAGELVITYTATKPPVKIRGGGS